MPQIGPLEIAVVLLVALLVFGPSKLPEVGKQAARGLREFKQFQANVRNDLQGMLQPDDDPDLDPDLEPDHEADAEIAAAADDFVPPAPPEDSLPEVPPADTRPPGETPPADASQ